MPRPRRAAATPSENQAVRIFLSGTGFQHSDLTSRMPALPGRSTVPLDAAPPTAAHPTPINRRGRAGFKPAPALMPRPAPPPQLLKKVSPNKVNYFVFRRPALPQGGHPGLFCGRASCSATPSFSYSPAPVDGLRPGLLFIPRRLPSRRPPGIQYESLYESRDRGGISEADLVGKL